MPSIFLSHSSRDKVAARKVASTLAMHGHSVWFDEWDIKVGDCIVEAIEIGLDSSEFILILLSQNSVSSGWVEREWKTKYWDEVSEKRITVIPALIQECEIPTLLKTKKYADLTKNFDSGISQILEALQAHTFGSTESATTAATSVSKPEVQEAKRLKTEAELLKDFRSRASRASENIIEYLSQAACLQLPPDMFGDFGAKAVQEKNQNLANCIDRLRQVKEIIDSLPQASIGTVTERRQLIVKISNIEKLTYWFNVNSSYGTNPEYYFVDPMRSAAIAWETPRIFPNQPDRIYFDRDGKEWNRVESYDRVHHARLHEDYKSLLEILRSFPKN